MEYSGWTLLDNIIIVEKLNGGISQGYIVDPKNKKQLEGAVSWGIVKTQRRDEDGKILRDDKGNVLCDVTEPLIHAFVNDNFEVTLFDSANGSCQGGRLSFWNCLIEKDDKKFIIGINADLLLDLLMQSTFINGKCQTKVCFARKNGGVGLLHKEMKQYKDAVNDMKLKSSMSKGKTTKWEIGKNYVTTTLDSTYLGTLYFPVKCEITHRGYRVTDVTLEKINGNLKHILKDNVTDLKSQFIQLNEKFEQIPVGSRGYKTFYDIKNCLSNYFYAEYLEKLPARKQGDKDLGYYEDYYSDLQNALDTFKKNVTKLVINNQTRLTPIELRTLIVNTTDTLTEIDYTLIDVILQSNKKRAGEYDYYNVNNKL